MDFAESIVAEQGLTDTQYEADVAGLEKAEEPEAEKFETEKPKAKSEAEEPKVKSEAEEPEAEESEAEEPEAEEPEAEEPEAEEPEVEEPEAKKHPKGYVPLQALREAREQINSLKEALQTVKTAVPQNKEDPKSTTIDFAELSKDEEEALAADDPASFADYMNQKFTARFAKLAKAQEQYFEQTQLNAAYSVIDTVAPGILDAESETQQVFYETAVANGFDENVFYLTNPATKVVLEDGSTRLLGADAAKVLALIRNLQKRVQSNPEKKSVVKKKGTVSLRKALTKAPVSSSKNRVLSPAAFGALSPSDKEKFLRGEI